MRTWREYVLIKLSVQINATEGDLCTFSTFTGSCVLPGLDRNRMGLSSICLICTKSTIRGNLKLDVDREITY